MPFSADGWPGSKARDGNGAQNLVAAGKKPGYEKEKCDTKAASADYVSTR